MLMNHLHLYSLYYVLNLMIKKILTLYPQWDAFSLPELGNFLKVLDREEAEIIQELKHKYAYMKLIMEKRKKELLNSPNKSS